MTFPLIKASFIQNLFQDKRRNYIIFSQLISGILGLFSGKLIAIYVTPSNFGKYNLEFAFLTFFFSIFLSPFLQFTKTTTKTLLTKIGYQYYLILGFTLVFLCFLLSNVFYLFIFFNNSISSIFLIVSFSYLLFSSINSILSDYLNVDNNIKVFSIFNISKSIIGFTFLFSVFYYLHGFLSEITALWLFQIVPLFLFLFFKNFYAVKPNTKLKIGFLKFTKAYFKYSWPLIILAFWSWFNNYFDRYVLEYYMNDHFVGLYNASYGLGSKFFLILSPIFIITLTPFVYQNIPLTLKKNQISRFVQYYLMIGGIILLILLFSYQIIGEILLSSAYESSFYLIFWVALGYFVLTLTYLYETLFFSERKTKTILISNIISAIICVLLNLILVPIYNLSGSIISLIVGALARFTYSYFKFIKI